MRQSSEVDSTVTFSIPSASRCSASSATVPVRAGTSHTLLTRLPARLLTRTHTVPESLATSIAHTRSNTSSCSVSGISSGSCFNSLVLQQHPHVRTGWVARGPRSRGTEILTGVLEATVRDPSRSGRGTRLKYGLTHPRKRRRRRATRPHFHACEASPEGKQGTQMKCPTHVQLDISVRQLE